MEGGKGCGVVLAWGKKRAAEKKNETKAAARLDEKNKKQRKKNMSNQQLLNEQAHATIERTSTQTQQSKLLNEGARLKRVAGTRV
jgi:hypothetical protein